MRIIISPAKKMRTDTDTLEISGLPVFLEQAELLLQYLRGMNGSELKKLWACSDKIAEENAERLKNMNLSGNLTPAILSYDGIAFKYMAPYVFEYDQFDYVQENLRILSGFYGVLRPLDGVTPYRLEMQAKAKPDGTDNLYDFWGSRIYDEVKDDSGIIINLASKEYSKAVEKYLKPEDRFVTCIFGEISDGRVVQKGVYAKMARGEMVRYLAETNTQSPEAMKAFDRLGYSFSEELSSENEYVFLRREN